MKKAILNTFFACLVISCLLISRDVEAGNHISNDTTWSGTVQISSQIFIDDSATLTILPGTHVIFNGNIGIRVEGRLLAVGTLNDSIIFTSSNPSAGWDGILFDATSSSNDSSMICYCVLSYGITTGSSWHGLNGGAIYMNYFDKLKLANCSLRYNKSSGGLGGALYCFVSSPLIINNIFEGNYGGDGGAIYMHSCLPVISDNLFIDNSAGYNGGALCFVYTGSQVINCTFTGNSAVYEGGAVDIENDSGNDFFNCILYGDTCSSGMEIAITDNAYGADLYYCVLDGGLSGIGGLGGPSMVHNYVNCLNTNPLFTGTGKFPYSLQSSSPCVNTGKPDMTGFPIPSLDMAGNPRICPVCWVRIDIGAFEYQEISSISVSGTVSVNTYWCADTVKITGNIIVNDGVTLTIGKGILVSIMGPYGIRVNGTLLAEADTNHLIRFKPHSSGQKWSGLTFDHVNVSNDTSRLAFCTFQYASASYRASEGYNGGAIYINNFSKLKISNCQFSDNYANSQGGAIYLDSVNMQITGCTFSNDTSQSGGAISAHNSTLVLNSDQFNYNYAYGGDCTTFDASDGGAVSLDTCTVIVENCTFQHNKTGCTGGGLYAFASSLTLTQGNFSNNEADDCTSNGGGGGMYCGNTILNATGSTFSQNYANWGAGVLLSGVSGTVMQNTITGNMAGLASCGYGVGGGITFKNSSGVVFSLNQVTNNSSPLRGGIDLNYSNPQIIQNLVTDNYAGSAGGGITFDHSSPQMLNNTISNNIGGIYAAGLWFISSSSPDIRNNIVYGNYLGTSAEDQVYLTDNTSNPNFYYCDITGGVSGFSGNNSHYTGTYENNIDGDPSFSGSANEPYQILPGSPCFNSGDPTTTTGNTGTTDLAGNPRIMNGRIDIGGYETSRGQDTYGGNALNITSAADSVILDNPDNFLFGNTFTVEFWMKPDSMNSDFNSIVKKGSEWEVNFFYDEYASLLSFGINNMSVMGFFEIPGSLLLNHWTHVAAVFNNAAANPYLTIYLNGEEGSPDVPVPIQHGSSPVVIGNGYLGQIEELRIWQTARTPDEIRADMHLMIPPATSGLITYHQFDNYYSGNRIADISGGNNGTLINMTVPNCFVPSTVPAAGGTSNQQVFQTAGNVSFPGTDFSMNVLTVSMPDTIVVSRLDTLPNTGPPGSNTVYSRYWILDNYGGATQTANMFFQVKQSLVPADSIYPDRNRLYLRGSNSDSSWTFVENATSASVALNSVVFNNVSQTGQFLVPRKLTPDRYPGNALSFNGTNQYVKVDPLYYSSPSSITVEFWMYPTTAGSNPSAVIYHGDNGEFMITITQSAIIFGVKLSNQTWYNVTGPAPVLNHWQHVCGVWDSSSGMNLYINGVLCQSLTTPALLLYDPGNGYLPSFGCYNRMSQFFSGRLDEIRIWNVARTTQQIQENMHLTIGGDAPGLIGYWQLNEGSENFAQDHGGGHMGTLVNMNNNNWITSTIPAGGGTSFTRSVSSTGQVSFTGTGLTMNFTQKTGTDQIVVSCIDTSSNSNPPCQASLMNDQYWIVHQYGTGTFSTGMTFTVRANLTPADSANPSGILLYDRNCTSDSVWIFRLRAASVNADLDQVTFQGITSFGQFITGRNRTIYVKSNATGNNSGTSWGNAFTSLQSALDSVTPGNRIWVAAGNYKPSSTYDIPLATSRHKHFRMKEDVEIFGGFAGDEPDTFALSARNLAANATILSGDLNNNGRDESDCYHVFYHPSGLGLTGTALLDGFTIQGSNGDGATPFDIGGGMLNISNSPTVRNCIFNNNYALNGGGMGNQTASPTLTNCLFVDNASTPGGGGMYNTAQSSPVIINCTFANNTAITGGGIENSGNCNPVFDNCIFWGNVATASSHPGNQFYIDQGTTTLNYSCYANDTTDVYLTGGGIFIATNQDITTDPLFVDTTGGDYRLYGTSYCVNAGNNLYNSYPSDIRGKPRIQNTTIDMGPYEWTAGTDPLAPLFIWTGALSSDWNTPGNWNQNRVPGPQDDVYIPSVTNNPMIDNNPGTPARCNNLSVASNAILTVSQGKMIIVNGTLTINP